MSPSLMAPAAAATANAATANVTTGAYSNGSAQLYQTIATTGGTMTNYSTWGATGSNCSLTYDTLRDVVEQYERAWWPPVAMRGFRNAGILDALFEVMPDGRVKFRPGVGRELKLPDGAVLRLKADGNYVIDAADAKVVYRANWNREFNPYVNASDLLTRFLGYVAGLGIRKEDVKTLPLALFVNWLVLEAASKDQDEPPPEVVPVPKHRLLTARVKPRCLVCQRFIPRASAQAGFSYCDPDHAARHFARLTAGRAA